MEKEIYLTLLQGFFTGAGLIIAIGAQNAFVLRQGLMKNQVFITALFCTLADAALIVVGVAGLGKIMTTNPILLLVAKWGGALFLFWYGLRSFRAIFRSESLHPEKVKGPVRPSLKTTLLTLAALTFLNPHVYLDTVVLLGSIGSQFESNERPFFALGAMFASLVWFFGLCYGARLLAPFFESPKAWKVLDFGIGCIMWGIALSLLLFHH
ncbi:MAG TPA: LysE/ArgO family amino acid transporter [Rhabdochlamydiaceae bacterium]|nr:LysE/ArgO family amino acid transporter [Rhabdochlamydiaceae bacterium]